MDRFFDEVARVLATPMPRRKAFMIIGGVVLGALVPRVALAACVAGCTPGGGPCTVNTQCCTGICGNINNQGNGTCPTNGNKGVCCSDSDCANGLSCCSGKCFNK